MRKFVICCCCSIDFDLSGVSGFFLSSFPLSFTDIYVFLKLISLCSSTKLKCYLYAKNYTFVLVAHTSDDKRNFYSTLC